MDLEDIIISPRSTKPTYERLQAAISASFLERFSFSFSQHWS